MTKDETKDILIEVGAKMLDARIRGFDAECNIDVANTDLRTAAGDWSAAAEELIERTGDTLTDLSPDEQLECFEQSCALLGADPNHPAFNEERATFALMRNRAGAELN